MILRITTEVSIWQVWDNMRYFDKVTFQEVHFPGYMPIMADPSCTYSDEAAICKAFIGIRDLLEAHGGDVEAVRKTVSSYTVLDMLQDAIEKKAGPMFMAGEEKTFEFWMKMYQRRNMSRALVKASHYHYMFFHVSPNIPFHRLVSMMRRLPDFLKMPPEEKPTMAIEWLSAPKVSDDADAGFIAYVDGRNLFGCIDPAQLGIPAQIWEFEKGKPPKRLK